jgi:hypothetical protein
MSKALNLAGSRSHNVGDVWAAGQRRRVVALGEHPAALMGGGWWSRGRQAGQGRGGSGSGPHCCCSAHAARKHT